MTLWVCIGVYVIGMAATPGVVSFITGKPWAERYQPFGDDVGVFVTMLLWPIVIFTWIVHAWSCWMSGIGADLNKWFKELLADD